MSRSGVRVPSPAPLYLTPNKALRRTDFQAKCFSFSSGCPNSVHSDSVCLWHPSGDSGQDGPNVMSLKLSYAP